MTKILDERYKQIVDNELLNIFNTLSTSINTKANSSDVYTKLETDEQIRLKVAEIVASAPEDFDTLKEISDWLNTHAESAAAMNVQIQDNASDIAKLQSEIQSQSTTIGTHENKIGVLTNNVSSLSTGLSAAIQNISNAQADIDDNSDDISALKERVALNKSTLGYQKKNLLKNNAKSTTVQGVIITVNNDKSITVSGANTGGTIWHNVYGTVDIPMTELEIGQSYILSGTPTDNLDNNGKRTAYLRIEKSAMVIAADSNGNGVEFTVNENARPEYVTLCIGSGADYTDKPITFYPMIRHSEITDSTYEPYIDDVDTRITDSKNDIAVNQSTLGYTKKNLLPIPSSPVVMSGVTISYDNEGYMTSNVTNDLRQWTHGCANNVIFLKAGTYIYSTHVKTAPTSSGHHFAQAYDENDNGIFACRTDGNNISRFTLTEDKKIYIIEKINDGCVATMIRNADVTDGTYEPYVKSVDERLQTLEHYHNNVSTDSTIACEYDCISGSGEVVSALWLKSFEGKFVHIRIGCIQSSGDEPYIWSNHLVRLPEQGAVPMSSGIMLADEGITGYIVIFWDCTNGTAKITGVNTSLKDKYTTIKATITPLAIAAM